MPGKPLLIPVEDLPENSTNIKGTFYISPAGELYLVPQMGYPTMVLRLEQNGQGFIPSIRYISAATTITTDDYTIVITGNSFDQPLPQNPANGQVFNIKNMGNGNVNLTATSIDNVGVLTINAGSSASVQYTGTTGTYIII